MSEADSTRGRVVAVCVGDRRGGPKRPVGQAQLAKNFGLSGDADTGPSSRQVALLDRRRLAPGAASGPFGALGENLVVDGLDLGALAPGATVRIGDALLEMTGPVPDGPLFSAKVRLPGIVTEGDQIFVESPAPRTVPTLVGGAGTPGGKGGEPA